MDQAKTGERKPETGKEEGKALLAEALSRVNHCAGAEERMWLDPEHAAALLDLIRRLENEAHAPYQCYWRDRALVAESRLQGTL